MISLRISCLRFGSYKKWDHEYRGARYVLIEFGIISKRG